MSYKLTFCFPKQPHITLCAFVTASDEDGAKEKFKNDYPHLVECEILNVSLYEN